VSCDVRLEPGLALEGVLGRLEKKLDRCDVVLETRVGGRVTRIPVYDCAREAGVPEEYMPLFAGPGQTSLLVEKGGPPDHLPRPPLIQRFPESWRIYVIEG
jgi:hypothetical protein